MCYRLKKYEFFVRVHTSNKDLKILKIWLKRLFKYSTFTFSIIHILILHMWSSGWNKYALNEKHRERIYSYYAYIYGVSTIILYKLNYYTPCEILKSFSMWVMHRYVSINSSYDQSLTSHNTRVSPTRQGLSFYCCYIILSLTSARQHRMHILYA